jgi:hypothetical protein
MIGRGIATVGIWLSPAFIAYTAQGANTRVSEVLGFLYGVMMLLGTLIVWSGTIGDHNTNEIPRDR